MTGLAATATRREDGCLPAGRRTEFDTEREEEQP